MNRGENKGKYKGNKLRKIITDWRRQAKKSKKDELKKANKAISNKRR